MPLLRYLVKCDNKETIKTLIFCARIVLPSRPSSRTRVNLASAERGTTPAQCPLLRVTAKFGMEFFAARNFAQRNFRGKNYSFLGRRSLINGYQLPKIQLAFHRIGSVQMTVSYTQEFNKMSSLERILPF